MGDVDELIEELFDLVVLFSWFAFLVVSFFTKDAWIPFAILTAAIIIHDALVDVARAIAETRRREEKDD